MRLGKELLWVAPAVVLVQGLFRACPAVEGLLSLALMHAALLVEGLVALPCCMLPSSRGAAGYHPAECIGDA